MGTKKKRKLGGWDTRLSANDLTIKANVRGTANACFNQSQN